MAQLLPIGGFVAVGGRVAHGAPFRAVLVRRSELENRMWCAFVADDGTLGTEFEIDPEVGIRYLGEDYKPPAITPARRGQRRYGPNQAPIVVDLDWWER